MTRKERHRIKGKYMAFGPLLDPQVLSVFDAADEMDAALIIGRAAIKKAIDHLEAFGGCACGRTPPLCTVCVLVDALGDKARSILNQPEKGEGA